MNERSLRWPDSPRWSAAMRLWVLTVVVALLAAVWWNVRQFTILVVSAVLLAYLLHPLIRWTQRRLRLSRPRAALAVYAGMASVAVMLGLMLAPAAARGIQGFDVAAQVERMGVMLFDGMPSTVRVLGRTVAMGPLYDDLRRQAASVEAALFGRQSLVWLVGLATDFAFTVIGALFTIVASLYVAMDGERMTRWLAGKVPAPYRPAYEAVQLEIARVWQSFFRGQLILAGVIALLTTLGLLSLGMPYAVPLGLLAGLLEVVPRLGPVLSVVPAVAVALAQPASFLPGLPRGVYVLLVVALYVVVQQIENNVLVPRVLGTSVNLPPAIVLVSTLAGAALGGVPGILLAPPLVGTARILGSWVFEKVVDADDGPAEPATGPPTDGRGGAAAAGAPAGGAAAHADSPLDAVVDPRGGLPGPDGGL